MTKKLRYSLIFILIMLCLFIANLFIGSVSIPLSSIIDILLGKELEKQAWTQIVLNYRLPQAITALLTGAAVAVSGLLLQTSFRNPLADPGILGISAGANLGVALVVLLFGTGFGATFVYSISNSLAIILGAFIGASIILAIIIAFASVIRNNIMLLIIGIMVGYLTSSLISMLQFWTTSDRAYTFMLWGMGNFSNLSLEELPLYAITISVGLLIAILLIKPLNALLLGERYASNLGINIKTVRFMLLLCAGLLTAITTAFCGPISFIGLAVPHMARLVLGTSNHKFLLPSTMMIGGIIALLCNIISVLPGTTGLIPINAITPVFGAPVIIYVILRQRKTQYFN